MQTTAIRAIRRARHIRVPAFAPVPLRARADGWTDLRQAAFLVAQARTRSVVAAGEMGMSRMSAYRLRQRAVAESFAALWDMLAAGTPLAGRKLTPE